METNRQHENRVREQQWGVQELREALKNAGWLPPHSFKLRNPDKKGRYKHVRSFHFRVGQPGLSARMEQALPPQERLRIYRECGYQMSHDDPIPGAGLSPWASLQEQLAYAVIQGYTQLESIGQTFLDLWFLLGRAVRPLEPLLVREEWYEFHHLNYQVVSPYHGITPLKPEPLHEGSILENEGWMMECQGSLRSLKLVHFISGGYGAELEREVQREDDPYLVNIAQEYLLLLSFRAQLPEDQQILLALHRTELFEQLVAWGPQQLAPAGTRYRCPSWMEHILNRGYY